MVARSLARYGYIAVVQDCRGTGDSEPNTWDLYVSRSTEALALAASYHAITLG
jgi:predicted acyl esterase